jgi:hypothetical protein
MTTKLTLGLRNHLVQTPAATALRNSGLLGRSQTWQDGWIFTDVPFTTIEKYSAKALVVITEAPGGSPSMNNTSRFRRLNFDVWASPTRLADGSPAKRDADLHIEEVIDAFRPYLHTIDPGVPGLSQDPFIAYMGQPGQARMWGTAPQVAAGAGVLVMSCEITGEPDFSDVRDGNGARMGRIPLEVHFA